jgi:hypothetical protein
VSHRRKVLIALGAFAAAPWVFAQQTKALRVGWLPNDDEANVSSFTAFRQGLRLCRRAGTNMIQSHGNES